MAKIRATGGGRRSSCRIPGRERRRSEPRRPSLRSSAAGASWLLICAGETFASRVCIAQLVRAGVARPSAAPTMAHAARPRVPAPPAGANCGAFPCLSSSDDGARARRGPARLRRCGSGLGPGVIAQSRRGRAGAAVVYARSASFGIRTRLLMPFLSRSDGTAVRRPMGTAVTLLMAPVHVSPTRRPMSVVAVSDRRGD